MSVGNLKDNGNKGNNFPFQLGALQLLKMINDSITGGGGGGAGLATEATALSILSAIQNGQEFEQTMVIDQGGAGCPANCPVYLQVRIWDTVTHTFGPPVYYDAAGAVVVPVGPLQFINPTYTLQDILVQVTAINAVVSATTSRTPTLVAVPPNTPLANTTAGVKQLSIRVTSGGNGQINGVSVPNGFTVTYTANGNDTIGSISYQTGAGTNMLISYLT